MSAARGIAPQISEGELLQMVFGGETVYEDEIARITFGQAAEKLPNWARGKRQFGVRWMVVPHDQGVGSATDIDYNEEGAAYQAYRAYLFVAQNSSSASLEKTVFSADGHRWEYAPSGCWCFCCYWDPETGELWYSPPSGAESLIGSADNLDEAAALMADRGLI